MLEKLKDMLESTNFEYYVYFFKGDLPAKAEREYTSLLNKHNIKSDSWDMSGNLVIGSEANLKKFIKDLKSNSELKSIIKFDDKPTPVDNKYR